MTIKTLSLALLLASSGSAWAADALDSGDFNSHVLNHKSPYCGCCTEWTKHMKDAGFTVEEKLHDDMNAVKQELGLVPKLASCHTAEIGGYVFEGHIPADDIKAFLANPPKNAIGLAVPGMPMGSPGMEHGDEKDTYAVYAFNERGQVFEYRTHQGNR